MQLPPRGGTWVGNTFVISKSYEIQVLPSEWLHASKTFPKSILYANTGRIGRTLTPLSADRDVVFAGANKSPTDMDYV
ncbi:hypothetical protein V1477_004249 [Vespula maculifrons]|uniref:Uncharacterized protein n=1 Tax=Vespula maculifrons TaxID=7453 RepID=A0ABD2CR31_VESMC